MGGNDSISTVTLFRDRDFVPISIQPNVEDVNEREHEQESADSDDDDDEEEKSMRQRSRSHSQHSRVANISSISSILNPSPLSKSIGEAMSHTQHTQSEPKVAVEIDQDT